MDRSIDRSIDRSTDGEMERWRVFRVFRVSGALKSSRDCGAQDVVSWLILKSDCASTEVRYVAIWPLKKKTFQKPTSSQKPLRQLEVTK